MTFLDDVLAAKRAEIDLLRRHPPAAAAFPAPEFGRSLRGPGLSVIAEIKRRSPSKGALVNTLDAAATARAYAAGGASAISCLTDRRFFGALTGDVALTRTAGLPVLRKDFLIDEVQIDESLDLGVSAVLLIARILPRGRLETLHAHAVSRGLDVLLEVHDEADLDRALAAGASIVGVNNRDLETLEVDKERALRLRQHIPAGVISVAESGVCTRDEVRRIEDVGFDAVLIGQALVTSFDPATTLMDLMGRTAGVSR